MGNGIVEDLVESVVETVPVVETPAVEAPVAAEAAPIVEQPKQTVPLATYLEKKSALKQAEIEAAELRGRLAAMEQLRQTPQPEVVDDPYAGIAPDTLLTPADLQRIEANRAAQQQKQAQQAAEAQRVADARESYTTALTATPDLTDVINAGEAYLTKGDKIDIFEGGKQAYQLAYQRCKLRLAEAGKLPTPTPAPLPATVAAKPEIKQPDPVPVPEQNMTPAKRLVSFLTE